MKYCDLHNHSVYSDGSYTPCQLVSYAKELGISAIALSDHNTTDGLLEMAREGERQGLEVVLGSEITTEYKGKEIHLLALLIKEEKIPEMSEFLRERLEIKARSNEDLERRLRADGYKIDLEKMKEKYGKNINRAHFAKELILGGYVETTKQAFETILKPNGKYYKAVLRPQVIDVIPMVKKWEAVPVIAHPLLSLEREELEELLPLAKEAGLAGIEVYYPEFDSEKRAYLSELCEKYDLVKSGGSDFHGDVKTHSQLGSADVPYSSYLELKKRR